MRHTAILLVVVIACLWGLACRDTHERPAAVVASRTSQTPQLPSNPDSLHRWNAAHIPVTFCVDERKQGWLSNDNFRSLVTTAFDTWGVPYRNDGACSGATRLDDGVNEIGWGTLQAPSPGLVYEAGVTMLAYRACAIDCGDDERGAITEADIVIDANPPPEFASRRCLLGTVLHEVGHFLGLEHSPGPAIMQAETSGCILALTDGDRRALNDRYGQVTSLVSTSSAPSPDDAGSPTNDADAVKSLIHYQFGLFRSGNLPEVYKTYAPRFQALCPYDEFRKINLASSIDESKVDVIDLQVRVDGDRAYASYRYTYAGTPTAQVADSDPDVYVRIGGKWYDDIDTHTQCK